MTCTPFRSGDVSGVVCTTRRPKKVCACGRDATYLCDEPVAGRSKRKTCDQPVCDRCVVVVSQNVHRCPSCELRAQTPTTGRPTVAPAAVEEPNRPQLGLFGAFGVAPVPTWRSVDESTVRPREVVHRPETMTAPASSPAPARVDEIAPGSPELSAAHDHLLGVLAARVRALELAEPSRWLICPDRITGSMDAAEVAPAAWKEPALRMVNCERVSVGLYEVHGNGSWTLRGRMRTDGRAA